MIIREYIFSDWTAITEMLKDEGLEEEEMSFSTNRTFVAISRGDVVGFYTYKMEGVFPHLQHFCVGKGVRDGTLFIARELIKDFRKRIEAEGYPKVIINAPKNKSRISKLIQWYFKAPEPYGTSEAHQFYLVTV